MKLAFGYIRRSSYKQRENNSIEIQKEHIQSFAKRNGMEVPDEFLFIEDVTSAFSVRASRRKELMRLQQTIIEMGIPRVIFYEGSRMDRTAYSFVLDFYRPLHDLFPNIEVYTTNSIKPFNPDDMETKIAFILYRHESEIKSERAVNGLMTTLENNRDKRPGSKVPYGYNQIEKELVPNENAEIVTFIFYLQSWGFSLGKITSVLNEAEIPSPSGRTWRPSTIEKILKNPVYTGMLVWNIRKIHSEEKVYKIKDFSDPLIDQFFIQLNENNVRLQKEFGRINTPFLFLNKIKCSSCNTMLLNQNGSTGRESKKYHYHYYVCKHCDYKLEINEVHDNLMPKIFKHVQNLANNEATKTRALQDLENITETINQNICNIDKQVKKLEQNYSEAEANNDREYQLWVGQARDQLLSNLKSFINNEQKCEDLYEAIDSDHFFNRFNKILEFELDNPEKRLIILYFVNTAVVLPDHTLNVIYQDSIFESFNLIDKGQSTES